MKLSQFKTNAAALDQGRWVDEIPEMPGLRLKVRAFGNSDDKRIQAKAMEQLPRSKRLRGKLDDSDNDAIMTKRLTGAILVDWDGMEDDAGAPLPYSAEAAAKMLADPDYAKLRDVVMWAVAVATEEAAEEEAAARKN